jgi:hypothetical protein
METLKLRDACGKPLAPNAPKGLCPEPDPLDLNHELDSPRTLPLCPLPFQERISTLTDKFVRLWYATEPKPLSIPRFISSEEKQHLEGNAEAAGKEFERLLLRFPKTAGARRDAWRQELLNALKELARDCLLLPERGLNLFFTEPAMEATRQFVTRAHAFDATVRDEHLFQALRNLWVVNFIQLLSGREPALSRAAFGYSMLYPCTDNFLDDPAVLSRSKAEFGLWLGRRLQGVRSRPAGFHAEQAECLVTLIEQDYPRTKHPDLYSCLGAIHEAQMASLRQHQSCPCPDEQTLLELTCAKGGTSVLSDAYLVSGCPAPEEVEFAYGYGVALQLMDDLQDVKTDQESGHTTLFTRELASGPLDGLARRLWHFLETVLAPLESLAAPKVRCIKGLIQENCSVMLLHSVVANLAFFTPAFAAELETASPFHIAFMRSQKKRLSSQFGHVVRQLRRRRRIRSLSELLK